MIQERYNIYVLTSNGTHSVYATRYVEDENWASDDAGLDDYWAGNELVDFNTDIRNCDD